MTATPTRCHQALTSERIFTRLTPKVFSRPCSTMITRNVPKVFAAVTVSPVVRLRNAIVVVAAPKSIAAVTAISPRKLNQPTNHAHAGLSRRARAAAHQYRAPAVGYAEQTSAIARATRVTIPPTNSQPIVMDSGPPAFMAMPYEVIAPARIEMMENETAKLEKPDSRRCSSWRYPRLARSSSSELAAGVVGRVLALIGGSSGREGEGATVRPMIRPPRPACQ